MPLKDYSVKFGRDPVMGLEGRNAFPFFYTLVNHNDVDWTPGIYPNQPDISTYAVRCPAAAVTPHYVRLDPDYNYKLIAIKYSAYIWVPPNGSAGSYIWYLNNNYTQEPSGTPAYSAIQVSLSVQGSGSATLFGGQNVQAINTTNARIPLAVECMEGYDYGFQALRCEYLLPLQGVLAFEFTNTLPEGRGEPDIYVAAMMYGMKIRL
jgi:hypothetical protein